MQEGLVRHKRCDNISDVAIRQKYCQKWHPSHRVLASSMLNSIIVLQCKNQTQYNAKNIPHHHLILLIIYKLCRCFFLAPKEPYYTIVWLMGMKEDSTIKLKSGPSNIHQHSSQCKHKQKHWHCVILNAYKSIYVFNYYFNRYATPLFWVLKKNMCRKNFVWKKTMQYVNNETILTRGNIGTFAWK